MTNLNVNLCKMFYKKKKKKLNVYQEKEHISISYHSLYLIQLIYFPVYHMKWNK